MFYWKVAASAVGIILVCGCAMEVADECPLPWRYRDQFGYQVHPTLETPSGIHVDPSGRKVDPVTIDRLVDEVEQCLKDTFGDPPVIPEDVMRDGMCAKNTFPLPYPREQCLTIKIPNDWVPNCDGSEQVLPWAAPDVGCLQKGLTPTKKCPCRWRAGIQDQYTAVSTPNLFNLKDPLVRILTGCNSPWTSPVLAKCAHSTTDKHYGE